MFEVVLVDDHPLIRDGLSSIINEQPDMRVVGEAESGALALKIVRELKPHVVVLDIALPDFNGLDLVTQFQQFSKSINKEIHIVILSMFLKESLVYQALQNGARGFIVKTASSQEVVQAIRHVCQGRYYLSPEVSTNIIPEFLKAHQSTRPTNLYNLLTEREQQIFRLLAEGHSNKDISKFLSISYKTVERHRANIMAKLDVHNYHALLKYAIEVGILES
jgi:two-component system, NarL family, response regulator NreC